MGIDVTDPVDGTKLDGSCEGSLEGTTVGSTVGYDGSNVITPCVGSYEGIELDGSNVGAFDGAMEGSTVGSDGSRIGDTNTRIRRNKIFLKQNFRFIFSS